jgi:hypothetical protein
MKAYSNVMIDIVYSCGEVVVSLAFMVGVGWRWAVVGWIVLGGVAFPGLFALE